MTKVVIDPGHGGSDPGAVSGGYQEKAFTLDIGLKVRDALTSQYIVDVLMTRTTDRTVSLAERANLANNNNADYFCSVHINAGGGTGWESYIYNGPVSNFTIQAQNTIHDTVMKLIGSRYQVRDRGKKRANFYVLRETRMPAVLLENLFIDTTADRNLLRNANFIRDLSQATADGIAQALSLPRRSTALYRVIAGSFQNRSNAEERKGFLDRNGIEAVVVTTVIDGATWYRVQAGAFTQRANAEARLSEVRALGIQDAYILVD
ncbi:N-acetylmuramoyl-L-alanine amidase [Desmospora profundinema]|uniref:N-acetylmuramoyl-L-alanine amidase n=1 Tax=Desmospora profundinema TaxID=1571184 RepID=A0ABU1ILP5_9BACL|nr:N-acetylmuramoyl-L-alanine amidase [Desmospora profundinema]MDR6224710.1 N-acetylmuramoyl-L-alanine amidase [Desmospora profundinema]